LLVPLFRRVQRGDTALIVSVITLSELLVKPEQNGDTEAIERIGDLLSEDGILVVDADRGIARRAAALRARRRLALADAIIIATAIETGCDAAVGNDHDWSQLDEITFIRLDDLLTQTAEEA
jgi:predicted nucleic acid-binding protein